MSFFAATSRTSICPVAEAPSVERIWVSMFTSLTSKGMYCSASHWIDSSSSATDICGIWIFLMITECPETLIAVSFCLIRISPISSWMAWTMAVEFISALSTIASGGRGFIPKLRSEYTASPRRRVSLSWIIFTDVEPMSRPMASLPRAISALPS